MMVWGGFNFDFGNFNTGARYNPATDNWIAVSTANVPTARTFHTAVWTGSEMIVWGGYNTGDDLNTGGRYDPNTDTWIPTSTANAPAARESHTAVWTGSEMIVWGGLGCGSNCRLNTGGRYDPATDTWTAISTVNAPAARWNHTAIWTGSEMIVWGGTDQTNYLNTGGRYNPATDSWTPTGLANVPLGRQSHTAVWTGSEMTVWGGVENSGHLTSTGGRYNPLNDSWVATNLANAPSQRNDHTGVWTSSEMIIWGGQPTGQPTGYTGGRYSATTDSWLPTTIMNVPPGRDSHTAVWTGTQMIVWGGFGVGSNETSTGGRYCAQPSTPLVQGAVSRMTHGSAGAQDVNLPLSGTPGIECRSGGGGGDYTIALTFLANVSVNGNPQAAVTSGIGTIGSGGFSNGGVVTTAENVVIIPLTNVANAQTITLRLNAVNGSTDLTIPMSVLLGDSNGDGVVNSGDAVQARSRSGQLTDSTNFRSDVNLDGVTNAADTAIIRGQSGQFVP